MELYFYDVRWFLISKIVFITLSMSLAMFI